MAWLWINFCGMTDKGNTFYIHQVKIFFNIRRNRNKPIYCSHVLEDIQFFITRKSIGLRPNRGFLGKPLLHCYSIWYIWGAQHTEWSQFRWLWQNIFLEAKFKKREEIISCYKKVREHFEKSIFWTFEDFLLVRSL